MGIKYGKKDKKVKIKNMRGNDDVERDVPGWLCRCQTCNELGYVDMSATVPEYCQDCWDASHP